MSLAWPIAEMARRDLSAAILSVVSVVATANTTVVIPAGYMIVGITMRNTTANAVTGGIKIGTTSGGTDVIIALTVGASAVIGVPAATTLLTYFGQTDQTLYIQAVVLWNSASVNIAFLVAKVF